MCVAALGHGTDKQERLSSADWLNASLAAGFLLVGLVKRRLKK